MEGGRAEEGVRRVERVRRVGYRQMGVAAVNGLLLAKEVGVGVERRLASRRQVTPAERGRWTWAAVGKGGRRSPLGVARADGGPGPRARIERRRVRPVLDLV